MSFTTVPPNLSTFLLSAKLSLASGGMTQSWTTIETQAATFVATVTPSILPGQTNQASPIIITSVVTREGLDNLKIWTIDEQPTECSSRWVLYSSLSGTTIVTSGDYNDAVSELSLAPAYWRTCYPDAPATPAYSPAMCTGRQKLLLPISAVIPGPTPVTSWSALCCPTSSLTTTRDMKYFRRCEKVFSTPFAAHTLASGSSGTIWMTQGAQTVLSTGTLLAEPVLVYWQSSDLSRFPNAYATSLAAQMGVAINVQIASDVGFATPPGSISTSFPNTSTEGPKVLSASGQSEGAMVGLGLVGFVGALLIAGLVIYAHVRRNKKRQAFATQHGAVTELSTQSTGFKRLIQGKWRAEMEARQAPVEVGSARSNIPAPFIAELEAPVPHPDKDPDQFSFTGSNFETRAMDGKESEQVDTANPGRRTSPDETTFA